MDITTINTLIGSLAAVITAYGGVEGLKVWLNRKNIKAEAEFSLQQKKDEAEFELNRKHTDFFHQQLDYLDKQLADQEQLIRRQNDTILQDSKDKAALELELQKYRCQVPNCPMRQPPNGY